MIEYENDVPIKSFQVYYGDGSLMYDLKKNGYHWTMIKYSQEGTIIDKQEGSVEIVKSLY